MSKRFDARPERSAYFLVKRKCQIVLRCGRCVPNEAATLRRAFSFLSFIYNINFEGFDVCHIQFFRLVTK